MYIRLMDSAEKNVSYGTLFSQNSTVNDEMVQLKIDEIICSFELEKKEWQIDDIVELLPLSWEISLLDNESIIWV